MLFTLGIGSNMGIASVLITAIKDAFPKLKQWFLAIAVAVFGISVGSIYITPGGQYLINLFDFFGASFVAFFLAVGELITFGWIYGVERLCKDIEFMLSRKTGLYWRICWRFITPALMAFILIYTIVDMKLITYRDYVYPTLLYGMYYMIFFKEFILIFFNFYFLMFLQSLDGFCLQLVSHNCLFGCFMRTIRKQGKHL